MIGSGELGIGSYRVQRLDPISHAALGRTLAALDTRERLGAGATTACVLGALCPDIDLARTLQGWDVYLVHHQGGTHSIVGALGCGVLTGTVVRAFARRSRWIALAGAATAGALSHVVLDVVSGGDLSVFAPFWNHVLSLPLFAMADPWLLAVLLVGAAASVRAPRSAARALMGIALVIALKAAIYVRASAIERRAASRGTATHAEAVFGSWTRWNFIEVYPETLDWWSVDARSATAHRTMSLARGLRAPLALRSRQLPTVRNLLASHDDTFARVESEPGGGHEVRWSALRYCRSEPAESDPVCGLWFGGEYDPGGRATAAVVRVGSLVQRRGAGVSSDHQ